ncbi:dihydroorotase [Candidatus Woesearchaeota archaeon CG10_big_fil_rev_8_21_14_0_10_44_13]|nr:MAG: dihydroorotase [Candidatus Woesearchaeota archaeon CG10_big_fil_rev_8_21_14_0_10_44_13]
MDLAIKDAKLLSRGEEVIRNIYILNGKINKITDRRIRSKKMIDAKENFVIPGAIDPHVHFREPGLTYKEDFCTGSMAAAAGGITTVFDMPNTVPPTLTYFDIEEKRFLAKKSIVNYGFYIGASKDNIGEIKKANHDANLPIPGTKLFMNLSTGKMMMEDRDIIRQVFRNSKLVAVHAEGPKVEEAIQYAIKTGTKLYLCHISAADEIETIKRYRDESEWVARNVFVEVTPHHLFLTEKDHHEQGAFAKMIPSLKTKKDQAALWNAIADGTVDTIGTDHAPHTIEEKKAKENPPGGIPGEETMLPLMLDAMNRGRLTMERIVEMTSKNPARIFCMRNKGRIAEGCDADLTIIDMNMFGEVRNGDLRTRCNWSPFNGWKLKGWPVVTIVNGRVVFDHGKIYKNQGKEVVFRGRTDGRAD